MKFVLVTGCPRSGTTAVASWLLTAPGARGAMETRRSVIAHAMLKAASRFRAFEAGFPLAAGWDSTSPAALRLATRHAISAMGSLPFTWPGVLVDKEPLEPVAFPDDDYPEYLQNMLDVWGNDVQLLCMVRNPIDTIASMLRRKWGYSVSDLEPHSLNLQQCIRIWKKAARAVTRSAVIAPERTRIQTFEALCNFPELESEKIRNVTGLGLADFVPKPAGHGHFDAYTVEETAWERQVLTAYDERPKAAPRVVLLTGEPGTGKTSIAKEVAASLGPDQLRVVHLDGDDLRRRLWPELGYDAASRAEATRRAMALAVSVAYAGAIVLVSMIAPSEDERRKSGEQAARLGVTFRIVRVTAPRLVRFQRRPQDVHDFAYEEPSAPNAVIDTNMTNVVDAAKVVLSLL